MCLNNSRQARNLCCRRKEGRKEEREEGWSDLTSGQVKVGNVKDAEHQDHVPLGLEKLFSAL